MQEPQTATNAHRRPLQTGDPLIIRIRNVQEADAGPLAALLNRIIDAGAYTIMAGPVTLEAQLAFIRSFPAHGIFHAAVDLDTGFVVGIQDVVPLAPDTPALHHVGEISTFVEPALHGQGIGSRLGEETFEAARRKGFRKLRASIRADNPGAIAYYHALGFTTLGVAKAHAQVNGCYVDEVVAEKALA